MRKSSKLILVAGAVAALAYTVNHDGTMYVSKGEAQTAMHWNNADFDANTPHSRRVRERHGRADVHL